MTWMLIGVVLLLAFGPVLWLVPSKKDKRLTALRARGRTEGLVVELRRIPKLDPTARERVSSGGRIRTPSIECASYGYAMARKLEYLPGWRVARVKADVKPDPFVSWRYDRRPVGDGRRYLTDMLEQVISILDQLPEDVIALEISARMLLVYWLEKPGSTVDTVVEIGRLLRGLEASLSSLEDRISEKFESNDS
jgi:hypothetical protein